MKIQRIVVLLIISSVIVLLFNSCKEEVLTTDIFEIEEADPANMTSLEVSGLGEIYVNSDRVNINEGIAQIKGTLFSKVDDEFVAITSGDFSLAGLSGSESYEDLTGYGLATVPDIGVFSDILTDVTSGANFFMQDGASIRENDELAPLDENLNYLGITLDESLGEKLQFTIKNSTFQPKAFYMDPNDPMIYFRGDVGTPKFQIIDAALGLSARSQLVFTPYEYSEEMSAIMKTPLPSLNGNIFIGGLIPIPQYNIEVYGEALVGFTANENGFNDFFENGFEGAAFRMGVNGTVLLSEGFISYLPSMEVGRATVVAELEEAGNNYIQVAGEVQMQADFLGELLNNLDGGVLTSQFSMPVQTVEAYFYVGDNLDNSQFFIRSSMSMIIPGIGEQDLVDAMFGVDAEHIFIGADMGVPGIAEIYVSGDVYYDGTFTIIGGTSMNIDVEVASVSVLFQVTITQDGFVITAKASGEIAEVGFTVGVDIRLDWETGDMELCMDLPDPIGNTCVGLRHGKQRTLNGKIHKNWTLEDELQQY